MVACSNSPSKRPRLCVGDAFFPVNAMRYTIQKASVTSARLSSRTRRHLRRHPMRRTVRARLSALPQRFGNLDAAGLGFPSVKALQKAIKAFCAG